MVPSLGGDDSKDCSRRELSTLISQTLDSLDLVT